MSEAQHSQVAEALSSDEALGSRDDWWYDEQTDDDTGSDSDNELDAAERVDPNNPNEIVAFNLLRETATILCGATLNDDPAEDPYALHNENRPVELTDPEIRLGNHAPESTLVGEFGTERHRKRYNPETGYITGGETTRVVIEKRPLPQLMELIEEWVRGVAARDESGLRESDIQAVLDLARGLKKNQHNNQKDDLDIVTKVVETVR